MKEKNAVKSRSKTLLTWDSRNGLDPAAHFTITEKGVRRRTGKTMSTAKGIVKGLGTAILLAGIATGSSGSSAWGPASYHLSRDSQNEQFISWKKIHNVTIDKEKYVISLQDIQGVEMRVCCTQETFEPALKLISENTTGTKHNRSTIPPSSADQTAQVCPSCATAVTAGAKFCGSCGSSIKPPKTPTNVNPKSCLHCGAKIGPRVRFCEMCGAQI